MHEPSLTKTAARQNATDGAALYYRCFVYIQLRDSKKVDEAYNTPTEQRRVHGFFFQAEDGIRDVAVTGVQTCALPILPKQRPSVWNARPRNRKEDRQQSERVADCRSLVACARVRELAGPHAAHVDQCHRDNQDRKSVVQGRSVAIVAPRSIVLQFTRYV